MCCFVNQECFFEQLLIFLPENSDLWRWTQALFAGLRHRQNPPAIRSLSRSYAPFLCGCTIARVRELSIGGMSPFVESGLRLFEIHWLFQFERHEEYREMLSEYRRMAENRGYPRYALLCPDAESAGSYATSPATSRAELTSCRKEIRCVAE